MHTTGKTQTDQLCNLAYKAGRKAHDLMEKASDETYSAIDEARHAAAEVRAEAHEAAVAARKTVRKHPLASAAAMLGLGVIFGLFLKPSDKGRP